MEFVRRSLSRGSATPTPVAVPVNSAPVVVDSKKQEKNGAEPVLAVSTSTLFPAYSAKEAHRTLVGVKLAAAATGDEERNALDVVVCLDVSGSMSGEKLRLCKLTICTLLKELKKEDSFALVTFSEQAKTVFEPSLMADAKKQVALGRLAKVETEGCTNLSGGLFESLELEAKLVASGKANKVRTVLLLTDGMANRGITDSEKILKTLKGVMQDERNQSTSLYCFGYGSDTNADLLRGIAEVSSGGSYYFVESADQVGPAFADALGGLLSVVAQTVTIKARGVNGTTILKCLSHPQAAGTQGEVSLGDLFAEESRDLVFEVSLSQVEPSDEPSAIVEVEVSCLSVLSCAQERFRAVAVATRPLETNTAERVPNAALALQKARVDTAAAIEEAKALADKESDLASARAIITAALANLKPLGDDDLALMLRSDLQETLEMLSSRAEYKRAGAHYMQSKAASHRTQRCVESRPDAELASKNVYRGSKKTAMQSKWSSTMG